MERASWIRRMFEEGILLKKKFGQDKVFDFSLGNPIIEPPPEFRTTLRRILDDPTPGMHRYMPNAGYPSTRAAVAESLTRETGLAFNFKHILMSCGAGGGLNVVLKTLLNPGEEVLLFAPYFPEYVFYIDNCGGRPRVVQTDGAFLPDLEAVDEAVNESTKAVFVNSPNNPTGVVYPRAKLEELARLLESKQKRFGNPIYLVADEPYRKILFEGAEFVSLFTLYRNTIQVYSHSKDLGLAGERIGYVAAHPGMDAIEDFLAGLTFSNRTLGFINAPALMQHALRELQGVTVNVAEYERKKNRIYPALRDMGYELVRPQGAFYLFPKSFDPDDVAFARELQENLVLTVPGSGFGRPGHIRVSYCVDDATIEGALPIFERVARKYGRAG